MTDENEFTAGQKSRRLLDISLMVGFVGLVMVAGLGLEGSPWAWPWLSISIVALHLASASGAAIGDQELMQQIARKLDEHLDKQQNAFAVLDIRLDEIEDSLLDQRKSQK